MISPLFMLVTLVVPSGAHGEQHRVDIDDSGLVCSVTFDGHRLPFDKDGHLDLSRIELDGGEIHVESSLAPRLKNCAEDVTSQLLAAGFTLPKITVYSPQ